MKQLISGTEQALSCYLDRRRRSHSHSHPSFLPRKVVSKFPGHKRGPGLEQWLPWEKRRSLGEETGESAGLLRWPEPTGNCPQEVPANLWRAVWTQGHSSHGLAENSCWGAARWTEMADIAEYWRELGVLMQPEWRSTGHSVEKVLRNKDHALP